MTQRFPQPYQCPALTSGLEQRHATISNTNIIWSTDKVIFTELIFLIIDSQEVTNYEEQRPA